MPAVVPTQEEYAALLSRVEALESLPSGGGSGGPIMWHKNSGDNSELVPHLYLSYANGYRFEALYSIPLPDLHPGDLVDLRATFEVTNPHSYNCMCARYLIIADNPKDVTGIMVSEAAGRNVTPNMHHDVHHDFGTLKVTEEMTGKHAVCVAYAASTKAGPTNAIFVEQDYGRLEAKVIRAAALE